MAASADPVASLPPELVFQVLSYLSARQLAAAGQVSRAWADAAHDGVLWARLYRAAAWPHPYCPRVRGGAEEGGPRGAFARLAARRRRAEGRTTGRVGRVWGARGSGGGAGVVGGEGGVVAMVVGAEGARARLRRVGGRVSRGSVALAEVVVVRTAGRREGVGARGTEDVLGRMRVPFVPASVAVAAQDDGGVVVVLAHGGVMHALGVDGGDVAMLGKLRAHANAIVHVAACRDRVAAVSESGAVSVWDAPRGKVLFRYERAGAGAQMVAFAAAGHVVLGGRELVVLDGAEGDVVVDVDVATSGELVTTWTMAGSTRAAALTSLGRVLVFDVANGAMVYASDPIPSFKTWFHAAAFDALGHILVAVDELNNVHVCTPDAAVTLAVFRAGAAALTQIAITSTSHHAYLPCFDGAVRVVAL